MRVELKCFHDNEQEQIFRFDAAELSLTNGVREIKYGEAPLQTGSIFLRITGRVEIRNTGEPK